MKPALQIESLKLTQFKNYDAQKFSFCAGINCFTGSNGVGKTNILDAIYFLCLTKNHRNLPDKQLIRHGADFFRVEGHFLTEGRTQKVVIKMASDKRKELEVDGAPITRFADHIGQFPIVMIAPDDVALVQEGSEERRRYLDSTLSQVSAPYLEQWLLYNALLKQRNALLKSFGEQRYFDPVYLEAIDRQMVVPALVLHEERARMAGHIGPLFASLYGAISGNKEVAALQYAPSWHESGDFYTFLEETQDKDRAVERTSVGPHRDDITFLLDGMPVKKFASQGQMKSFLLALRLAQFEYLRQETGATPILLLDDIFDKLDAHRVQQLVALLIERRVGQVFMTDTHRSRIESAVAAVAPIFQIIDIP